MTNTTSHFNQANASLKEQEICSSAFCADKRFLTLLGHYDPSNDPQNKLLTTVLSGRAVSANIDSVKIYDEMVQCVLQRNKFVAIEHLSLAINKFNPELFTTLRSYYPCSNDLVIKVPVDHQTYWSLSDVNKQSLERMHIKLDTVQEMDLTPLH